MAHAQNEVEEMVSFAGALVLNIGTLTDEWVDAMIKAGKKASAQNTPIILDPVGSGATRLRTTSAKRIMAETDIRVLRGNASEVLSLRNVDAKTKGVDAIHSVDDAAHTAVTLAGELNTTLAITGPVDLITDGTRMVRVSNGHPLMGFVTGTGCTATAVIGAFLSVDADPVSAAATALAYLGLAGEVAGRDAAAPGTFMIKMLDALYTIAPEDLQNRSQLQAEPLS
jgi:hydroxyethylthiazole kinase